MLLLQLLLPACSTLLLYNNKQPTAQHSENECERSEPKKNISIRKPTRACSLQHSENECERSEPKKNISNRKPTARV